MEIEIAPLSVLIFFVIVELYFAGRQSAIGYNIPAIGRRRTNGDLP